MEASTNINIDPLKLFRPLISAILLNAYYSSLILKKLSGEELTSDLKVTAWEDIVHLFGQVDLDFLKMWNPELSQTSHTNSEDDQ